MTRVDSGTDPVAIVSPVRSLRLWHRPDFAKPGLPRVQQSTSAWPQVVTRCVGCESQIVTWRNPNRAHCVDMPHWAPVVRCSSCAAKLFERLRARAEGRA